MTNQSQDKIKVLHVLHGLNVGGAEAYIINALEEIKDTQYQFDFLLRSQDVNEKYKQLIATKNCKIHITSPFPKNFIKNTREVLKVLNQGKYDVVHLHANALVYVTPIILAKFLKVPIRIVHSHNSQSISKFGKVLHTINKKVINQFANKNLACSDLAGEWMFGKNSFEVVENGINTDKFLFSDVKRAEMRKKINCHEEIIVGHVGRFEEQKNHRFLLEVFSEFHKLEPKSKLCLIGEGSLRVEIEKKVINLGLQKKVIFLGKDEVVADWYNAFDVFLMPSKYEGLAIVLIESQTNGLPSLVANTVSKSSKITNHIVFEDLNKSSEQWANHLISIAKQPIDRKKSKHQVDISGYSTKTTVRRLEEIYNG
ncbi:MAG: glycosyltransferase family 1 protein [Culicoidibacterales bacterium]